jgi:hypothetical protein
MQQQARVNKLRALFSLQFEAAARRARASA